MHVVAATHLIKTPVEDTSVEKERGWKVKNKSPVYVCVCVFQINRKRVIKESTPHRFLFKGRRGPRRLNTKGAFSLP